MNTIDITELFLLRCAHRLILRQDDVRTLHTKFIDEDYLVYL